MVIELFNKSGPTGEHFYRIINWSHFNCWICKFIHYLSRLLLKNDNLRICSKIIFCKSYLWATVFLWFLHIMSLYIKNYEIEPYQVGVKWKDCLYMLRCKIVMNHWIFIGRTDDEAEVPILWPPDMKNPVIGKDPDAGKDWKQEKEITEGEMVGWHHQLNKDEFEQTLGDSERQGSLACCSPWSYKESNMTEQL